jgi:hypothetical protein
MDVFSFVMFFAQATWGNPLSITRDLPLAKWICGIVGRDEKLINLIATSYNNDTLIVGFCDKYLQTISHRHFSILLQVPLTPP